MSTRTGWRRTERLRLESGMVARQALGVRKRAAKAAGKSQDWADRLCNGHGEAYRFALVVEASEHPGHWERWIRTLVARKVARMTPDELVQRFWVLMQAEAEAQGREDQVSQMFARDGDLLAIAEAAEHEASIEIERAHIARRLHELRIDPRLA